MSLITTSAALADFCRSLSGAEFITVDTEFMREGTFWPHLCLLQIAGPDEAVGPNTPEAMRSGVFHGLRGAVQGLVERFAQQIGHYPLVVATGGESGILFKDWELVDRLVPELTLLGLELTHRRGRPVDG